MTCGRTGAARSTRPPLLDNIKNDTEPHLTGEREGFSGSGCYDGSAHENREVYLNRLERGRPYIMSIMPVSPSPEAAAGVGEGQGSSCGIRCRPHGTREQLLGYVETARPCSGRISEPQDQCDVFLFGLDQDHRLRLLRICPVPASVCHYLLTSLSRSVLYRRGLCAEVSGG
jgi:hypothetical protein